MQQLKKWKYWNLTAIRGGSDCLSDLGFLSLILDESKCNKESYHERSIRSMSLKSVSCFEKGKINSLMAIFWLDIKAAIVHFRFVCCAIIIACWLRCCASLHKHSRMVRKSFHSKYFDQIRLVRSTSSWYISVCSGLWNQMAMRFDWNTARLVSYKEKK